MARRLWWVAVGLGLATATAVGAADEAERQVWAFRVQGQAWNGNGPLKFGQWPVRDQALRLALGGKLVPGMAQTDLLLPAERANVVQLSCDAGGARRCRLWFATGVSPALSPTKQVEFDLSPAVGYQEYTLDLKALSTWKDQVTQLRFDFLGGAAGSEVAVRWIKVLDGEKISKPLAYTTWRAGERPAPREFRAASLFNSHMVLQRDRPLPLWGRAQPGEVVTVQFAGQTRSATTSPTGQWRVTLDPLPLSAEPRTLTLASTVAGHTQALTDVVVGDVWLCGGQSNMGGSAFDNAPPAERRHELLETDYPDLRCVSLPTMNRATPLGNDECEDSLSWNPVLVNRLRGVSAVSYYFGQAVHASQRIPVGLVFIIKAGSQVEQWLDADTLRSCYTPEELQRVVGGTHLASGLYNGMVAPIPPCPLRGAIWYQGESNADNEARYLGYYRSLPALVRLWRRLWGESFPVLLVQLPAFSGGYPAGSWAHIREAQALTAARVPHVGLAVTFDEGDPTNLHPPNKYFVGTRLGLLARELVYGERLESSGPTLAAVEAQAGALVLRFAHAGDGLKARGELAGFELRGADDRWLPATAQLLAPDRVRLTAPGLAAPTAARYAWHNNPIATLFNSLSLPAGPFRTDTPAALAQAVTTTGATR